MKEKSTGKPTYEELEKEVKDLKAELSQHKREAAALRKSEAFFRELIEGSAQGVIIHRNLRPLFVNQAFADVHGYTIAEILEMETVLLLAAPHERSRLSGYQEARLQRKKAPIQYEYQGARKDGSFVWLDSRVMVVDWESERAIQVTVFDITERKRARKALQESEAKYRGLFENTKDAIVIADTKTGRILDVNKEAEQLIGRTRQELIGMHQSEIHPPEDSEYYIDKFREHVQKRRLLDLEAEVIKKDGSVVPIVINSSVVIIHGKEVIQGLFKDISEEKIILELREQIAERKLIEKAKGILMDHNEISEKEAMRLLQKESRRQRKRVKEIAKGVVSSEVILH